MSALVQCMGGGWCRSRDKCAHFYAPRLVGLEPAERLCGKVEEPEPIKPAVGATLSPAEVSA